MLKKIFIAFLPIIILIGLVFLLREQEKVVAVADDDTLSLVIITPNSDQIKYEFAVAFEKYYFNKYKKKEVVRYTFTVTNYDGYEGKVYANVLTYRNRVIGGDICSAGVSGFIHGFQKT